MIIKILVKIVELVERYLEKDKKVRFGTKAHCFMLMLKKARIEFEK